MPTTRKMVRRDIDQAVNNMKTAQEYLTRSGGQYERSYPDIYQSFCQIVALAQMLIEAAEALKKSI